MVIDKITEEIREKLETTSIREWGQLEVLCPHRTNNFAHYSGGVFLGYSGECNLINQEVFNSKCRWAFSVSSCIECKLVGKQDLTNPFLGQSIMIKAKAILSTLHSEESPARRKGVVYKDALDGLKNLGESNQNMRCYIYWLYSHQLISEEEFGTFSNLYNLNEDIGSPDGEQADEIRRFSHRDRI